MTKPIRRVAVIGAGVMGSGIASHLANCGVEALLLDIVPPDLNAGEKSAQSAPQATQSACAGRTKASAPAAGFETARETGQATWPKR